VTSPTAYPELNEVLQEITGHARQTFDGDYVGTYLVGSFALGAADEHSDCDFLVVVRSKPSGGAEQAVRALWAELPTRPRPWAHDLEGSYAELADLEDPGTVGRPWLYVDHGHTTMDWSEHCNREVVRWTLHEHGVTVDGPEPRTFTAGVSAEAIRERMRSDLPNLLDDILSWAPVEVAWTQRYVVATHARVAYSLVTGEITSKIRALDWAAERFGDRWRPLLAQVRDDRARGWNPDDPPRPGSLRAAFDFAAVCRESA
jgi:hypothetical protein